MKYLWCGLLGAPVIAGLALWAQTTPSAGPPAQPPSQQFANPPASPDDQTRIILDVTRVNILFTVTDKKGRFITDLGKDDFQIIESKRKALDRRCSV